jgi:hypothetical protein
MDPPGAAEGRAQDVSYKIPNFEHYNPRPSGRKELSDALRDGFMNDERMLQDHAFACPRNCKILQPIVSDRALLLVNLDFLVLKIRLRPNLRSLSVAQCSVQLRQFRTLELRPALQDRILVVLRRRQRFHLR